MTPSKIEHFLLFKFLQVGVTCIFALEPRQDCDPVCVDLHDKPYGCHQYGDCDWYCAALKMNCIFPKSYHCAKDNETHEFEEVCAEEKFCGKGGCIQMLN